ncbi:hypothetical protein MHBO_002657 [Bonamia ostreae]|uniref:polynucleotide adenylyltransferase n=1 Tax=Bonamia ostreae TaxID=126728 RepID=A0ABV2ANM8_9EUKA
MPIITPSYPAQNSTYNVTFSTFAFLREEISRAREIFKSGKDDIFEKLIEANTFFKNHKHYFQISGTCFIEEDFTAWFGWIESRIRRFVGTLEEILYFKLVPFPQSFNHDLEKQKNISFFIGSKIIIDKNEIKHNRNNKRKKINIVPAVKAFVKHINDFNSKTEGMSVKVNYISKSKLPDFVFASNGKRKRD